MGTPEIRRRLFSTLLAVTVTAGGAVRGQNAEKTTLRLGEASAPPGAPVVAPLTLTVAEGTRVGSVDVRLTFPKALLKFVKIEPSGLALAVEAIVKAEATDGADTTSSTVHVTVSTLGAGGSRKPLPSGVLGYLAFTVAPGAKPLTAIAFAHEATALTVDTPPAPVTPLTLDPAKITVANPPVPACFFYMH